MTQQHITGLTPQQVAESRAKHGANVLTPPEKNHSGNNFSRNSPTRSSSY